MNPIHICALLVLPVSIAAQESASPSDSEAKIKQKVTALIQPLVDDGWAHGIMVGVLHKNQEHYFSFGTLGDQGKTVPDRNTVYEIGSITKVFTSLVLADMVARGELALDDPVQELLPETIKVPAVGGKPITLGDLASHQSGMTSIPINFWQPGDNIYSSDVGGKRWGEYSEKQLIGFFKFPLPPFDGARKFNYSNLGMGTLGYALQRHADEPLETLIVDRICKPLKMQTTSFSLATSGTAFDADGNPLNNWPLEQSILGGAFALRSTCHDMLKLAAAHLEPSSTPLVDTIKLAIEPRGKINELENTGLGWRVNKYSVISSNGATGGFRAAIFIHPPTQTAVVMMSNMQVGGVLGGRATLFDGVAGILLNAILDAPVPDLNLPKPGQADESKFKDFVGTYKNPDDDSDGLNFPIEVSGDALTMTGPGQMKLRLWPIGEETFYTRTYDCEIKFERDDSGSVIGADVRFEGKQAKLQRRD